MNVVERLIESCRAAVREFDAGEAERAARDLVAEAVSDPAALAAALGNPERAGIAALYRASDLTVINFVWAPWMSLKPHDHCMWSVVGIFSGREDNVFWRRLPEETTPGAASPAIKVAIAAAKRRPGASATTMIEAAGARSLGVGDVAVLGADVIHSVVNPIDKMTRAIHVYGGDFFAPPRPRTEWDPETLAARPWNMEDTRRLFAEAEARARR